jgi:site-specific recombinase XerD
VRECYELIWHTYERELRAEGKLQTTVDAYRYALKSLSAALPEGTDLLSAGREHITAWLAQLAGTRSEATHDTYMVNAAVFFNHMVKAGYLEGASPMTGLDRPGRGDKIQRCPTADEVNALLRACEGRDWLDRRDMAMLRILCEAGTPRATELARLRTDSIDFKTDEITLHGKGRLERCIPFGAKTGRALMLWMRERGRQRLAAEPATKDLLFFTLFGPMNKDSLNSILERRSRIAGIKPINPHALRRFTYDLWDRNGGQVGPAMKLYGWRSPEMPGLYGKQNAGRRAVQHAKTMGLGDQLG